MPELPEVETVVRTYRPHVEGRRIAAFETRWAKNCRPSVAAVRDGVEGRRVLSLSRRAKQIVFSLDDNSVQLVHLRMSGRFAWAADFPDAEPPFVRATWTFDDGHALHFCDARKFGKITHARDLADATADLGPEPLEPAFTARALGAILSRRARQLKPLLLDQSVIAGLGNIYVDESLFLAGLHPLQRSDRLSPEQIRKLHSAIRRVLRKGIDKLGTTIDWIYPGGNMQDHLNVYGRDGEPCRRCGTTIVGMRVGQRGTRICPRCQPAPRRVRAVRPARKPRAAATA